MAIESSFTPQFKPVHSRSGWVLGVDYDYQKGELWIKFKKASRNALTPICIYTCGNDTHFRELQRVKSAGSYIHDWLYDESYQLVYEEELLSPTLVTH